MKRYILTLVALMVAVDSLWAFNHTTCEVASRVMNKGVPVVVITPENYSPRSDARYDVVYLLHGYSDNHTSWHERLGVGRYADLYNLIIVCPHGNNSWYWDSPADPAYRYETFVVEELVGWVDANYHTNAHRSGRAITGNSMGGHGALYLTLRHLETFGAVGSTSGGVDITPFDDWEIAQRLGSKEVYPERWEEYTVTNMLHLAPTDGSLAMVIDCGTEDFFYDVNCELHRKLSERGVPHDFTVRPGSHNWHYWRTSIAYQMLFFDNFFENN
ncbi:MAG: esterase family protein [Tidjanibacter sp.]|nr:esterase family protein [Tidjanibacter sp.]